MSHSFEVDPHAPPQAPVVAAPVAGDANFPRISTWWIVPLLIVTLGFYGPYWLYTRGKRLNESMSEALFPLVLPIAVAVLSATDLVVKLLLHTGSDAPLANPLQIGVHWFSVVVTLIVMFSFRNALREYAAAKSAHGFYVGPVFTFFFGLVYINYKLNELIDTRSSEHVEVAGPTKLAHQTA
jgi:hypothetical protein